MAASDKEWEVACLENVRAGLAAAADAPRSFDVSLAGDRPDTVLTLTWVDPRTNNVRRLCWRLWVDFAGAEPADVEQEVFVQYLEA